LGWKTLEISGARTPNKYLLRDGFAAKGFVEGQRGQQGDETDFTFWVLGINTEDREGRNFLTSGKVAAAKVRLLCRMRLDGTAHFVRGKHKEIAWDHTAGELHSR
jgi:hypothetical protein